jgi:hypothetical protein
VLDDRATEVGSVLDERLTRDLADQVLARDRRLKVLVDLGDLERRRHAALGKHDECFGRAREHARLALDTVLEPQHSALVPDQVEHVRWTHGDARIAPRAAVVIDVVNQDPRTDQLRRCNRRMLAPARGNHREHCHHEDGEAPECQRHDPGHPIKIQHKCGADAAQKPPERLRISLRAA